MTLQAPATNWPIRQPHTAQCAAPGKIAGGVLVPLQGFSLLSMRASEAFCPLGVGLTPGGHQGVSVRVHRGRHSNAQNPGATGSPVLADLATAR